MWHPGQQQNVIVQRTAYPVYMIHQQSDVPGLSTSSKIAIGVVVPVVVLLSIILGVCFFMRRSKRRKTSKFESSSSANVQEAKRSIDEPFLKMPAEPQPKNRVQSDNRREAAGIDPRASAALNRSSVSGEEAQRRSRVSSPDRPPMKNKRGWHWV